MDRTKPVSPALKPSLKTRSLRLALAVIVFLGGCSPASVTPPPEIQQPLAPTPAEVQPTALPTRPYYAPGELVDYTVQNGDTLPALLARFNTNERELRAANPILPQELTTLPPGMPMKIPIYYQPLWGTPYQIVPDAVFINGPAEIGFNPAVFVDQQPGWFKDYEEYSGNRMRRGGELVAYVALNFSISPRLLLALLEYQTGALSQPEMPDPLPRYPLKILDPTHQGIYAQLLLAANQLNNDYYRYRAGRLTSFEHPDGRLERPDPWQNAATVALQTYFARVSTQKEYEHATQGQGIAQTYRQLFGDPWNTPPHLPGSLQQPTLQLPFEAGKTWAFTGGPHAAWGEGDPLAALDFAPPAAARGCLPSEEWATAVADGFIIRTGPNMAILDLDQDRDERTGWVIFYLHLASEDMPRVGMRLKAGQPIGHPSCEGGRATGTHIHIARKYNGEWIQSDGPLAFNLNGWVAHNGSEPYLGNLTRYSQNIRACTCSDQKSQISADANK